MENVTLTQVLKTAMEYNQRKINTALPCKVVEFDKDTQLATVQIMIDRIDKDGNALAIPELEGIPVLQPFSGKIAITMPIEKDDTGMLIFNQRNIDTFIVEGTQATPFDRRMHDIQDAVLVMGLSSQKRVLSEYDDDGMAIRSEDNKTHIQLKQDGTINLNSGSTTIEIAKDGAVSITTDKLELTGDLEVTGKITATDNIESSADVKAGTTSLKTHTHSAGGTLIGYSGFVVTGLTGTPSP